MSDVAAAVPPATHADEDARFMALALSLGRRGLGTTWPNPSVGAVIVKDGVILARGWTQAGGRPHAEVEALRRAKKAAQGATLYVTLEPCAHRGKSPPCADAIIRAGIARVVSAMEDPNPEVAGAGHKRLADSKIVVDVGLCGEEARRTHSGHIMRMHEGRPHVMLKMALSADGKAALAGGKPVALSGEAARTRVFQMRAASDAILVGIGTVLSDNPQLTCRLPGMLEQSPVRIVLDSQLRLPMTSAVVATVRETPSWILGSGNPSAIAEQILAEKGCRVFRVGERGGRLDLKETLALLAEQGVTRLMVEGGPTVAKSFLAADLVDEAVLVRADKAVGADGIDALDAQGLEAFNGALKLETSERVGTDTLETYQRG